MPWCSRCVRWAIRSPFNFTAAFDMEVLVWGRTASLELARAEGHRERSGADEARRPIAQHQLRSADRTRGFAAAGQCSWHTPAGLRGV